MTKTQVLRSLTLGGALAACFAAFALAEEPADHASQNTPLNLDVVERGLPDGVALDLNARDGNGRRRFAGLDQAEPQERGLELELAADSGPVDVAIASRALIQPGTDGNLSREGRGSELRVGRGLTNGSNGQRQDSTYVFVASDNEALTWAPGARSDFGGPGSNLSLRGDRVEVGDLSAGVTVERNGVQASLAYVERSESTQVGSQGFTQDQSFTGVTVTVRR